MAGKSDQLVVAVRIDHLANIGAQRRQICTQPSARRHEADAADLRAYAHDNAGFGLFDDANALCLGELREHRRQAKRLQPEVSRTHSRHAARPNQQIGFDAAGEAEQGQIAGEIIALQQRTHKADRSAV